MEAGQVEEIILSNVDYILSRLSIYGQTPERVASIWNPYTLANILPEDLYDYCKDCDVEYWATYLSAVLVDATEEEDI